MGCEETAKQLCQTMHSGQRCPVYRNVELPCLCGACKVVFADCPSLATDTVLNFAYHTSSLLAGMIHFLCTISPCSVFVLGSEQYLGQVQVH